MRNRWADIKNMCRKSKKRIQISGLSNMGPQIVTGQLKFADQPFLDAVTKNCSCIYVDKWMRILGGAGEQGNRDIYTWNAIGINGVPGRVNGMLLAADDVVGGLYAINIGASEKCKGEVLYFAPDTLQWEETGLTYSSFLAWAIQGDCETYYQTMRWEGWRNDVKDVGIDQGVMLYPFLWAKECDIQSAEKKIVSFSEIVDVNFEMSERINSSMDYGR